MPIYDWACEKCDKEFETIESIKAYTGHAECPQCGNPGKRIYHRSSFYHVGASVKDAYKCPALGKVIKSDYDRSEQAKRLGVVEVGNDFGSGEKALSTFDKAREEKFKKSWDDV